MFIPVDVYAGFHYREPNFSSSNARISFRTQDLGIVIIDFSNILDSFPPTFLSRLGLIAVHIHKALHLKKLLYSEEYLLAQR